MELKKAIEIVKTIEQSCFTNTGRLCTIYGVGGIDSRNKNFKLALSTVLSALNKIDEERYILKEKALSIVESCPNCKIKIKEG